MHWAGNVFNNVH
jgi:hypothetical protein